MPATELLEEQYCLFEWRAELYAVPAEGVREVVSEPALFRVPGTPKTVVGVCHVHNEFLPVIQLDEDEVTDAGHLLVMTTDGEPWGLKADRVIGLRSLEAALNVECHGPGGGGATTVVGSATYERRVVRVLHSAKLLRLVEAEVRQRTNEESR